MSDPVWFFGCDDDPPFAGTVAVLVTAAAALTGACAVAAALAGLVAVRRWLR